MPKKVKMRIFGIKNFNLYDLLIKKKKKNVSVHDRAMGFYFQIKFCKCIQNKFSAEMSFSILFVVFKIFYIRL